MSAGRDDGVFGTVLLGRLQAGEGADRALGMFINTLPLRLHLAGQNVADALRDTHRQLSALLAHEQASLALAQRCSSATPLFNSLLNYRHTDAERDLVLVPGIALVSAEDILSYPLMLSVDDTASGFHLKAKAPRKVGAEQNPGLSGNDADQPGGCIGKYTASTVAGRAGAARP